MSLKYFFLKYALFVLLGLFTQNIFSQSVTDIQLSNQNIDENTTGFLADISSISEDENSSFVYQLVSGEGDTNNAFFEIINDNQLAVTIPFNFEETSSASLRLKSSLSSTAGEYDLILKGIIDFTTPLGGSSGKAIHLTAVRDIADLSQYGIGVANNGGGTDGVEYVFPQISANAGDQILVARLLNEFNQYVDTSQYWDISLDASTSGAISQNGDDAIELFMNVASYTDESGNNIIEGDLIETFGDVDVDGSGEYWEYVDTWAYKNNMGEWIFGEINCTDNSANIFAVNEDCIYPFVNGDSGVTYFVSETDIFEKSFDITINDINDAPVPDYITVDAIEQTPVNIVLTAVDPDSDEIVSFSVDDLPINGVLTDPENNNSSLTQGSVLSGNTITYTSNSDSATADYFTFLASDENLTSDSADLNFGNDIYHYEVEYDSSTNWQSITQFEDNEINSLEDLTVTPESLNFEIVPDDDFYHYIGGNLFASAPVINNPYPDEVNSSAKVVESFDESLVDNYETTVFYAYNLILDLNKSKKFSVKIYSETTMGVRFALGAEGSNQYSAGVQYAKTEFISQTNQWEELVFDFSEGADLYYVDAGSNLYNGYDGIINGGTLQAEGVSVPDNFIDQEPIMHPDGWNIEAYPSPNISQIIIYFYGSGVYQQVYIDDIMQISELPGENSDGLVDITIDPVDDDAYVHMSSSEIEENMAGIIGELSVYDPDSSLPPNSTSTLEEIVEYPYYGEENNDLSVLPYTGNYILQISEDYGDGLNGGLINFFLDGELIIENATIEEPDNFDDTNCWPNCDNPTAIVYSFFGNEGQTISFETVQVPEYSDNAMFTLSISEETIQISSVNIYNPDLAYSETLTYTGTYTLQLTEDYGDGLNGTLINIYLDGELIIQEATIEDGPLEPGGNDCWNEFGATEECIVQSSAIYTFNAAAGQTISYEQVAQGQYDDNPYIHLSFQVVNDFEYELVSGEGDINNDKFQVIENQLFLENSVNFEEQNELSIRVKATNDSGDEIESIVLISVINVNDIYINSTMPISYCAGDGTISIDNIYETFGELTYNWSGPNGFSSSDLSIDNLEPGQYTFTVSDQYFSFEEEFNLEVEEIYNNLQICYVTSDSEDYTKNRIFLNTQGNYNIQNYQIYAETTAVDEYELIGSVSAGESSFLDTNTNNQQLQKKYKVATLDNCGNVSDLSSAHYNTLLSATVAVDGSVSLEWQPYVGVEYSTFNIWRSVDQGEFTLISQLPSNQFNYNDTEADIDNFNYEYYVGIEVEECEESRSITEIVELRSNLLNLGVLSNNEFDISNKVTIYPNPADDYINIKLEGSLELITIEIYNGIGQIIMTTKDLIISTRDLESGIYFFKIKTNNGISLKNIIVK